MSYRNKDWLFQKYVVEKLSTTDIAKLCGVVHRTICIWLKKYEIDRRGIIEALTIKTQKKNANNSKLRDKEWLREQYIKQQKSIMRIAQEYALKQESIRRWLHKHDIECRDRTAHFVPLYGKNNFMYGKCGQLNPFYGRKHTDETKQLISKNNRGKNTGKNNPAWQDGRTSLIELIRKSTQYYNWRLSVYERDNFTCQCCGLKKDGQLNAHHIKPFSLILKEYEIKTSSQAYLCKELWDIDNGLTLCKDCHSKTETWGYGTTKLINELIMQKD